MDDIDRAARLLRLRLGVEPWFIRIGVSTIKGQPVLILYVSRRCRQAGEFQISGWQDFPVVVRVVTRYRLPRPPKKPNDSGPGENAA